MFILKVSAFKKKIIIRCSNDEGMEIFRSRIRSSKRHNAILNQVFRKSDRFKTSWGDEN